MTVNRRLAIAGVALALALGLSPAGAAAAAPAPATSGDATAQTTSAHAIEDARHAHDVLALAPARTAVLPRAATSVRPGKEVLGFAPYWELSASAGWHYEMLSTLAYFGLDVRGDGSFDTSTPGWTAWNSQNLVDTINRAHQAGDRVVVVIKQFDEATIKQIVTDTTATQAAVDNTIGAIASKQLDGVNVDFEGTVDPRYPDIQAGMTKFASQLSQAVHARFPAAEVSLDTYAGSASSDSGFFRIGDLAPAVDALFVMAYNMASSNLAGHAGPNAPLGGAFTYNDTLIMSQYLAKAPAAKIIMGVPYYGYEYSTVDSSPYSAFSSPLGSRATLYYSDVLNRLVCAGQAQLTRSWDGAAQTPWLSWFSPSSGDSCSGKYGSWRELYYDDAQSLGLKYDAILANGLRGTGIWALGFDGASPDLWNVLAQKFGLGHEPVTGTPSLIQGRFGVKGNFELVAPLASGGLVHYWRDNDAPGLPWNGGDTFGTGAGTFAAVTMIQSNFGSPGNLEVVARAGDALYSFWRDSGPGFEWHSSGIITRGASGNPVLVQSRFGTRGNFELITPMAAGGLAHFWRNNDDPGLPWSGTTSFGGSTMVDAAAMIQSNFGSPGNLEVVAREGATLQAFYRDSVAPFAWHQTLQIAGGVRGTPAMIQSRFGTRGNFELVTPVSGAGLEHFWRDNDSATLNWNGPSSFGLDVGQVEGASLIQSNFGSPGNLEVAEVSDARLQLFYRDSTAPFAWYGPLSL